MTSAAGHRNNDHCHVLSYLSDLSNRIRLTVLVNQVRFHVIADPKNLTAESRPGSKFQKLNEAVKRQYNLVDLPQNVTRYTGKQSDSQDSGHATGSEDDLTDTDSAVDMSQDETQAKRSSRALRRWMLSHFDSIFEEKAPADKTKDKLTIQQWYDVPLHVYELVIKSGKLDIEEMKLTMHLKRELEILQPTIPLYKFIRSLDIPWYPAKDAVILSEDDEGGYYHPTRVEVKGKPYFVKIVDPTQPSPTHREIYLLKRIEQLGLHKKMHVPQVEGILGSKSSKVQIFGFLQTDIEDPTPLTKLLDEDVPQAKRDKWARESERIIQLLHENDIVWGDAKADNFMVDKHDDLWIIDFGGSYTDGWVPPDLVETEEGDDIGVGKIVDALHDPVSNTMNPGVQDVEEEEDGKSPRGKKRKAMNDADDEEQEKNSAKGKKRADQKPQAKPARKAEAAKKSAQEDSEVDEEEADSEDCEPSDQDEDEKDQVASCICGKPDSGDMVGCDGEVCPHEWFHFSCVGLEEAPTQEHWYCKDCEAK